MHAVGSAGRRGGVVALHGMYLSVRLRGCVLFGGVMV